MMRQVTRLVLAPVLFAYGLCLFGGCSAKKSESERQPSSGLTQSQRDSMIAESNLPGAKVVGRAIEASDSAAARANRMDEQP